MTDPPFPLTRPALSEATHQAQVFRNRLEAVVRYMASVDEATPSDTLRADVIALARGQYEPGREKT